MNQIMLILIFIVELLNYSLGLSICFNSKRKWILVDITGCLVYIYILFNFNLQSYEFRLIMNTIILIILMVTILEKIGKRIVHIIMMLFVATLLEGIFNVPMNWIFRETIHYENIIYLSSSIITMTVLIAVQLLLKKRLLVYFKMIKLLQSWIPIIVLIMAIFLLFTIAGLNYANTQLNNEKFSIFVPIVSMIAFISVGFLGIFLIYYKITNEKIAQLIESERDLMKMSINNYELLLEKEEDTRRYRHDLKNHLICLRDLAQSKKLDLVNEYINKMLGQMKIIQDKSYHTGNVVMDAILGYYIPMVADDVNVIVTGYWSEYLEIDNVDICTIFSNLIQNAVEGLEVDGLDEKYLIVNIIQGNDYLEVLIRNSISHKQKDQNASLFKSKKSDSRNHGIGLRNAKETVNKNKGQFQISIFDKEVVSEVIFKYNNKKEPYTELSDRLRGNTGNP